MMSAFSAREETDADLMKLVQVDDADAFARLYDRHAARAYRVARAVCRDVGRAEDAVQDGFLAIWRNRTSYEQERGTFKAWSMRIVHYRALDSYRRTADLQRHTSDLDEEMPDFVSDSPPEEVIAKSEADSLKDSLKRLPEAQAEIIRLAYYGELSQSEIADQLNLPPGTVKGRMRLGLEKLRRNLPEENPDEFS